MKSSQIRSLRKTLRRLEHLVAAQLKDTGCCSGVTLSQCHALLEIESQGTPALGELAEALGLDKSTLSRTVDGLVNIGLVQRAPRPRDRRSVRLSLTRQGQRTCDRINAENDALYARVVQRLGSVNKEAVLKAFETLVEAMAAEWTETNGCAANRHADQKERITT